MQDDFFILLDWDNIGFKELNDRLEYWLLPYDKISEIEIRASPSLDGYHIYIKSFSEISPVLIFRKRFLWRDDSQKLCMDMINKKSRARGDLFSLKAYRKNGKWYKFKIFFFFISV